MYILDERGNQIVVSEFVQRFVIVRKPDAALIVASYGRGVDEAITIGRYANEKEAKDALIDLFNNLSYDGNCIRMLQSTYYDGERIKKDARTKRKGGS